MQRRALIPCIAERFSFLRDFSHQSRLFLGLFELKCGLDLALCLLDVHAVYLKRLTYYARAIIR